MERKAINHSGCLSSRRISEVLPGPLVFTRQSPSLDHVSSSSGSYSQTSNLALPFPPRFPFEIHSLQDLVIIGRLLNDLSLQDVNSMYRLCRRCRQNRHVPRSLLKLLMSTLMTDLHFQGKLSLSPTLPRTCRSRKASLPRPALTRSRYHSANSPRQLLLAL